MSRIALIYVFVFVLVAAACSTSPTGRKQMMLVPEAQMNDMGAKAFTDLKQQVPTEADKAVNDYVKCVTLPLTEAAKGDAKVAVWETVVFKDESANAFALPGGKIGVHTGLLKVAKTPDQLAAVIGHEVGHVIARHGAERVSTQIASQGGLVLIDAFVLGREMGQGQRTAILAALGLGAQVGIALPHSRTQETESDLIGLRLMAKAGFDPRESVALWKNMKAAAGGKAPPEWLSTHPANDTRIRNLEENIPDALRVHEASGRRTICKAP